MYTFTVLKRQEAKNNLLPIETKKFKIIVKKS